jgi:hypothetical protein
MISESCDWDVFATRNLLRVLLPICRFGCCNLCILLWNFWGGEECLVEDFHRLTSMKDGHRCKFRLLDLNPLAVRYQALSSYRGFENRRAYYIYLAYTHTKNLHISRRSIEAIEPASGTFGLIDYTICAVCLWCVDQHVYSGIPLSSESQLLQPII